MKKFLIGFFLVLATVLGGVWAASGSREVYAGDCDNNAVIKCGFTSQNQMKSLYKTNATRDLDDVYAHYGISADMINKGGKDGYVTKSGDVLVDGKVVATGARSVGREYINGSTSFTAGGTKFYERSTSVSFRADKIKAVVFMDSYGKFQAAILYDCGNPVKATPKPVPIYQCTGLAVTAIAGSRTRYSFKASNYTRDATFKHYTYTVKSGNKVVKTIESTGAVEYNQSTAGNYSVEATVTAVANGKTVTTPVGNCKASFTVKPVSYVCKSLKAVQNGERTNFVFTPTISLQNATLKSIVYTVKDANGAIIDTITRANTDAVSYAQEKIGKYTVTAVVTVTVDGKTATASGDCAAAFEVKPQPETPQYECTDLTGKLISGNRYNFALRYAMSGGAKLNNVSVDFGDSTGAQDVPLANVGSFEHQYAKQGTYKVVATVTFMLGQSATDVKTITCSTTILPTPCAENPELPADSPDCTKPCIEDSSSENGSECDTPEQLVNTGPGDIAGIFAATTIAGAIAHRLFWSRRLER